MWAKADRAMLESAAVVGWSVVGVLMVLCALTRARKAILDAHTARLRDRGEYRYTAVHS